VRSLMCPRARGYRVHRSAQRLDCFHAFRSAVLENRYLRSCGTIPRPFSLLSAPLQSSFDSTAALAFRREHRPTRVSALFATSLQRVHRSRGFPRPRCVPSSGVLSLSTVCSALKLAGLFHPTAASRTFPVQGFCRSAQPPSLIRRSCPHAVGARSTHRRIGCHRPDAPTSRLFSMQSRVSRVRRLDLAPDRSPPRVCCSQRCSSDHHVRFPERERS